MWAGRGFRGSGWRLAHGQRWAGNSEVTLGVGGGGGSGGGTQRADDVDWLSAGGGRSEGQDLLAGVRQLWVQRRVSRSKVRGQLTLQPCPQ